jgi:N utilization substance protein B
MNKPTGKRRRARELALRTLFQVDVGDIGVDEAIALSFSSSDLNEATLSFARELTTGTREHLARIDDLIQKYARGWALDRMTNVDRNLLRLAIFELLYLPDIPPSVTVDEAVEMAKKYSTAESGRFVNGILGNLVRHLEAELSAARGSQGEEDNSSDLAEHAP